MATLALYSVWRTVSTGCEGLDARPDSDAETRARTGPRKAALPAARGRIEEQPLDTTAQLEAFLRSVERQAYVTARTMTGDPEEAFDIVQDAMFRFVRKYSAWPNAEWRPLFFRILVNRSRDYRRRMAVRSRLMTWFRSDDDPDPVEAAPGPRTQDPVVELNGRESLAVLEEALEHLPLRQRETFVLRCLEGLSVADTVRAMGCSEGSVKTHYSRALTVLRDKLGDYYDG